MKIVHPFHVVENDFPISTDGLLGKEFLIKYDCILNYKSKMLNVCILNKNISLRMFSLTEKENEQHRINKIRTNRNFNKPSPSESKFVKRENKVENWRERKSQTNNDFIERKQWHGKTKLTNNAHTLNYNWRVRPQTMVNSDNYGYTKQMNNEPKMSDNNIRFVKENRNSWFKNMRTKNVYRFNNENKRSIDQYCIANETSENTEKNDFLNTNDDLIDFST